MILQDHATKCHVTLWVRCRHCISQSSHVLWDSVIVSHNLAKFSGHRYSFNQLCDFARPPDERVMWFYAWEPLIGDCPARFIDYVHYGSGNIMVLVCHVISQDM